MKKRFPNPFGGRPKPIELTNYFLLSPAVILKLIGESVSSVVAADGKTSLFKSLEYHRKRGHTPPKRLRERLLSMIPGDISIRSAFEQAMAVADGEGAEVLDRRSAPGEWECCLAGYYRGQSVADYSYASRYMLALESALLGPAYLIDQERYAEAAQAMVQDALIRPLISDDAHDILKSVHSRKRLLFVQLTIVLETALSHLAAGFAAKEQAGEGAVGDVSPLFPDSSGVERTPGQQFFRFMQQAVGETSMMALVRRLGEGRRGLRADLTVETLKRWSRGTHLPDTGHVSLIAQICCPEEKAHLLNMHGAMRYLTLLGYASEALLVQMEKHRSVPGASELFRPWPLFPFGLPTFGAWSRERYAFWHKYHLVRLPALAT